MVAIWQWVLENRSVVTDAISRIIQGSNRVQNHQMLAHLSYTRICFAVGVGTEEN